jgi:hypothetical protein
MKRVVKCFAVSNSQIPKQNSIKFFFSFRNLIYQFVLSFGFKFVYLCVYKSLVANLTYAYATLRQCAAKNPGKYRGEKAILHDEPVTGTQIFGFIKDNIEILKDEQEFQGEDGLFALKQLQMVLMDVDGNNGTRSSNGELVVFNDKDPKQICYGITLNKAEKRIVASFRGTSSFYDAIDDVKVAGAKVANPLFGVTKGQKRSLQIHQGFYGMLPRIIVDN